MIKKNKNWNMNLKYISQYKEYKNFFSIVIIYIKGKSYINVNSYKTRYFSFYWLSISTANKKITYLQFVYKVIT